MDSIVITETKTALMDNIAGSLYEVTRLVESGDLDVYPILDDIELSMDELMREYGSACVSDMAVLYKYKKKEIIEVLKEITKSDTNKVSEIILIIHDLNNANMVCWLSA